MDSSNLFNLIFNVENLVFDHLHPTNTPVIEITPGLEDDFAAHVFDDSETFHPCFTGR